MRYTPMITAFVATLFTATQAHSQFVPNTLNVELNKTQIVRLPQSASAVLIGNPDIADVTVHSRNTLFVVGRGYGETNLIVLGPDGREIMDADLTVVNSLPKNGVRLYNAKQRETYSCIPYCQPAPVLGDNPAFIGSNSNTQSPLSSATAQGIAAPVGGQAPSSNNDLIGGPSGEDSFDGVSAPAGNEGFGSGF